MRLRSSRRFALVGLLLAACQTAPPPPAPAPAPAAVEPEAAPAVLPAGPCERIVRLEVRKSTRTLTALCDDGGQHHFHVSLGREPGAKLLRGDSRTPEGRYRISGEPHESRFHRFIRIDYPSQEDALRARAAGRLSEREYAALASAIAAGSTAAQRSPLGGGLGLHGEGERWAGDSRHLDWTDGCIALSDADIDFIAPRVEVGTPIDVLP